MCGSNIISLVFGVWQGMGRGGGLNVEKIKCILTSCPQNMENMPTGNLQCGLMTLNWEVRLDLGLPFMP